MENQTPNVETPVTQAPAPTETAAPVESTPTEVATQVATVEPQIESTNAERVFATIGYVGPLFVLPLVAQPKSDYCKFHARQSMALLAIFFLQLIVLVAIPLLGSLLTFALFAAYILCMYNAYMGKMWKIPVVGAIAQKIDFDAFLGKATATVAHMNVVGAAADKVTNAMTSAVKSVTDSANDKIATPEEPQATAPTELVVK